MGLMLADWPRMGDVPLPHWLTRVNLAVTNNLTRPFAGRLPWFGILEHVGRRSGTVRQTPINIFPRGERYVIALTYGPDVEWLKNVLAAGGCRVRIQGRWLRLTEPRRFRDRRRRAVPPIVRVPLTILGVDEFVELREKR
jgi:deazaflavin-dependent oxidoreductase (nitroreductase family)